MADVLYRKYRPLTFAEVTEQQHVVKTIMNQLSGGKVAHAYLFAGPRGVGKTTIARLLARAVNCEARQIGQAEPCNTCASCCEAKQGRFLDIVEIDAASQTRVEETRENIIENVRFAPSRGKFKVFIIDEVHMLSTSSFNALLKTLEEPPEHAMFILATTELHKIPATIISRCQRFDFHRIPADEIIARLKKLSTAEGVTVEETVLATIARLSEGCLRDAESLLAQVLALGEEHISSKEASLVLPATHTEAVRKLLEVIAQKDSSSIVSLLTKSVEEGASMRHLLDELLAVTRSLLLTSLGGTHDDQLDTATKSTLDVCKTLLTSQEIEQLLDLVLQARGRSTPSHLPQLPLEIALITFCLGGQPPGPRLGANFRAPIATTKALSLATFKVTSTPPVPLRVAAEPTTEEIVTEAQVNDLRDKWARCVALVGETNVALPLVLQNAEILRAEAGRVVIAFPYLMHVEKMREAKNQRILEDAIEAVIMKRVLVVFEHKRPAGADPAAELLEVFGGVMTEMNNQQ